MSAANERFLIVMTTAGSDVQAREIAKGLVERRLAACVSIVARACSVYRWKGAIEEEDEKLLIIKTAQSRFDRLREAIRELHSYEVPEILALPVETGDPEYLDWLRSCVVEES